MDWPLAINRNRDALRAIIAALFKLAGLTSPRNRGEVVSEADRRGEVMLSRHILAAILLVLRPAESAVRRLVLIAALCGKFGSRPLAARAADPGLAARLQALPRLSPALRTTAFALFDTLKTFDPDDIWNVDPASQIRFQSGFDVDLDPSAGFRALPDSQQPVPAARIIGRLFAIGNALETLPAQTRRLLRWQARRDAALRAQKPIRITPLRPGFPPGWRQRSVHEIDDVLKECHRLAIDLMNVPDTG